MAYPAASSRALRQTGILKKLTAVIWFTCLIAGSFLPLSWKVHLRAHGPLHVPLHFAVFALSAILAAVTASSARGVFVRCMGVVALAFLLESLQSRFFGNVFEWADVTADTGGALASLLLMNAARFIGSRKY